MRLIPVYGLHVYPLELSLFLLMNIWLVDRLFGSDLFLPCMCVLCCTVHVVFFFFFI